MLQKQIAIKMIHDAFVKLILKASHTYASVAILFEDTLKCCAAVHPICIHECLLPLSVIKQVLVCLTIVLCYLPNEESRKLHFSQFYHPMSFV